MASPAPGGRGRSARAALKHLRNKPGLYNALVVAIFIGGVLLMVLPSELLTFKPKEKAELNLKVSGRRRRRRAASLRLCSPGKVDACKCSTVSLAGPAAQGPRGAHA